MVKTDRKLHSSLPPLFLERQLNDEPDFGFRAFRKERFDEAIQAWGKLSPASWAGVNLALAEAHFRKSLGQTERKAGILDLRAALNLAPEDGRFWYHLGLALHQEQDWAGAREAYGQASAHGFARREALAYVKGLLELEAGDLVEPGRARALPGLLPEEDLLAPIRALLGRAWATLAGTGAMPAVAQSKGTPAVPGMGGLLRGIGQVGLGQWAAGAQTLGSLSQDLFPGPVEALRVVFLARALERLGREKDAAKLRASTLARTKNPTLGAEVAEATLVDLEAWLAAGAWAWVVAAGQELQRHCPCRRAQVAVAIALDQLGREAAKAGRWSEAAKHWGDFRRLGGEALPGAAACLHNLALAHEALEEWGPAASAWQAVLNLLPKRITKTQVKAGSGYGGLSPEALLVRRDWIERRALEMRQRTGSVDEILRQRKALIKRKPDDLALRMAQIETFLNDDDLRGADREIDAVLRVAPDHPGALEAHAQILLRMHLPEAAEGRLRRVLALEPGRGSARATLALALATQATFMPNARRGKAIVLLEEAVELAPREARFRMMLAGLLMDGREPERARHHLDTALGLGGAAGQLVFQFWLRREALPEAKALVTQGLAQGVLDAEFLAAAAMACLEVAERLDDSFRGGRRSSGKGKASRAAEVQAWSAFGRALLDQAADLDPSCDGLRELVGLLLADHPALAVPYAERAAALLPSSPAVLMDLAVVQAGAGLFDEARQTLLKAERAARTHKDRVEAAGVMEMARMASSQGVKGLHAAFCDLLKMVERMDDFDLDDEEDPF